MAYGLTLKIRQQKIKTAVQEYTGTPLKIGQALQLYEAFIDFVASKIELNPIFTPNKSTSNRFFWTT